MEPDLAHRCGSLMAEHEKDGSKSREAQEKARRREAKQARLKEALRANLRRRKQSAAPNKPDSSGQ
jgi:hypothetical protein